MRKLAQHRADSPQLLAVTGRPGSLRRRTTSQGRKVFTPQSLPACAEPFGDGVGQAAGFSLQAGVAARADERQQLERLCRYLARPAVSEKRPLLPMD